MSKKSTGKTGNDGDADYGSANGPSSSSEEGKCILCSNLSLKEEGATGPSGDYSSTHKILTPNLDEPHRNHEIQTENTHTSNHTSHTSLDEELYGTSDAFNKNLEFLRDRLRLFNLADTENSAHQRHGTTSRSDSDKYSCQDGYLSTRETFINLSSPVENFKSRFTNSTGHLESTKPEFYETDNTTSSDSYIIPTKKQRFSPNSSKIVLNPSPENLNLSLWLHKCSAKNLRNTSVRTLSSKSSSIKDFVASSPQNFLLQPTLSSRTEGSLPENGINYVVPVKRRCTRETTPRIINNKVSNRGILPCFSKTVHTQCEDLDRFQSRKFLNEEISVLRVKPLSEGEDSSSHTITKRTKRESAGDSEILELGLNLPFSTVIDSTSSNKTTRLEPNIVVIDTSNGKRQKFKRKHRIAPISESSQSRPSSAITTCNSGDQWRSDLSSNEMHRKYYEDTSEISSNANSTLSCVVSTCASLPSNFPSASSHKTFPRKSEQNFKSKLFTKSASSNNSNFKCPKPEVFNPLFSSSLDVPKRSTHAYIFPAFSKITSICGAFRFENYTGDGGGDGGGDGSNDESEQINRKECYKTKAECLLNSPTLSPVAKQKNGESSDSAAVMKPSVATSSPTKSFLKHFTSKRKTQSTDMSFYSVPSYITLDQEYSNKNFRTSDGYSDTSKDIEEKRINCCCFNIFFPKRKRQFFP